MLLFYIKVGYIVTLSIRQSLLARNANFFIFFYLWCSFDCLWIVDYNEGFKLETAQTVEMCLYYDEENDHFTLHEFGYCFKLLESKPWYMSLLQKHLCTSNESKEYGRRNIEKDYKGHNSKHHFLCRCLTAYLY